MTIVEKSLNKIEKGKNLRELKELREQTAINLNNVRTQLKQLAEDEKVKIYIEQSVIAGELEIKLPKLELEIRKEEMTNCDHIWITSAIDRVWDGHRTDRYEYHACVKCGLNTKARERVYTDTYPTDLDYVMNSILSQLLSQPGKGIRTNIICDDKLARGIYNGILHDYPEIIDEQAVKYMEYAIYCIRTNEVTEGVKSSRVKRLGLKSKFTSWNEMDVVSSE